MKSTERIDIKAHREPWLWDAIALRVAHIQERPDGAPQISRGHPIQFEKLTEEGLCMEHPPTLRLSPGDAQGLMDELWRVGLRPTEGTGSAGQLGAVERHLADMRALAFHKTGAPKP